MTAKSWPLLRDLFHKAFDLDPADRDSWLQSVQEQNPDVYPDLVALLNVHDQEDGFLDESDFVLTPTDVAQGGRLGPYQLLHEAGRGGMGVVFEAVRQDGDFSQTVAVKILPQSLLRGESQRTFRAERQALASLDHPNIAKLLDWGATPAGNPYLVMEFVRDARPIDQFCTPATPLTKVLGLFLQICSAVAHAHRNLILHRDLKPGNVLVTPDGQCKLLDFGLAKSMDGAEAVTATLARRLTPAYASPEQIERGPVTTLSDVYSLGVTLHELLTGLLPSRNDRPPSAAPGLGRQRHKELRGDLDRIVLKAVRTEPERRYTSVEALAADVRNFLGGRPIQARGDARSYQVRKFIARNRLALGGALGVFVVLVAGVVVSSSQASRARRAESDALHERDRSVAAEAEARAERDRATDAGQAALAERNRAQQAETAAIQEGRRARREQQRADSETAIATAVNDFLRNDLLGQASSFRQARPDTSPDPDLKVRTALDRASMAIGNRFANQPLVEAALRHTIGNTYADLGLYAKAESQLSRAVEVRSHLLGNENPNTLSAMTGLANALRLQGKYPKAEALAVKVLEAQERLLGESHPNTLWALNVLANTYSAEGKYTQAEPLRIKYLTIWRRVAGPEDPNTLVGLNNLGALYQAEGKYPQAEALSREAIEIGKRVQGEEHPETLLHMNSLASIYRSEGKYPQALDLFTKVLEARRRVLGDDNPATVASLSDVAMIYQAQTKYPRAEELLIKVLETQRKMLGEEHPGTLNTMVNLSATYLSESKVELAHQLLTKVLEIRRRDLGNEHPATLDAIGLLAGAFRLQGKYADAEKLDAENLQAKRKTLGKEHPETLRSMTYVGIAKRALAKYQDAQNLFVEAANTSQRTLGADHPATLAALTQVAITYQAQGKYADAEAIHSQILKTRRGLLGAQNRDTLYSMENLALVYASQGRFAEAEKLDEQVIDGQRRALGPEHPYTLNTMEELSVIYQAQHRLSEADTLLAQVLSVRRRVQGATHPDVAHAMAGLADVYMQNGRYTESEPLLTQALNIDLQTLGAQHPTTAHLLTSLGLLRLHQQRYTDAESSFREALGAFGGDAGWAAFECRSLLGASLTEQRRFAEAEPLLLDGYKGIEDRSAEIPAYRRNALSESGERIVQLYERWPRPEKAAEWGSRLSAFRR